MTRLVLLAQDTVLPWHERLAVRLHMKVCVACPRFGRQLDVMREAMGRWRRYRDDG